MDTQNDAIFEAGDTFWKTIIFDIYVRFRRGALQVQLNICPLTCFSTNIVPPATSLLIGLKLHKFSKPIQMVHKTGVIKLPNFWRDQTIQIYCLVNFNKFQWIPLLTCIVWVGNMMTPVEIRGEKLFRTSGTSSISTSKTTTRTWGGCIKRFASKFESKSPWRVAENAKKGSSWSSNQSLPGRY